MTENEATLRSDNLSWRPAEPKWSAAEKVIARKAFDSALQSELRALIAEVKRKAQRIKDPAELWDLEEFLAKRRAQINRDYDYRYSVLPRVFGMLIGKGKLAEQQLRGLSEEKLELIRGWAKF